MSDDLVLNLLRAMRADMAEVRADIRELRERVGSIEVTLATMSRRVDRLAGDVELIKRRLDLSDNN